MLNSSKVNARIANELAQSKARLPFPGLGEEDKNAIQKYVHATTIVSPAARERKRDFPVNRHHSIDDPTARQVLGMAKSVRNSVTKQRPLGSEYDYNEARAVPLPTGSVKSVRSGLTKDNLNKLPSIENNRYENGSELLSSKYSFSQVSKVGLKLGNAAGQNKSKTNKLRAREAADQISEASEEEEGVILKSVISPKLEPQKMYARRRTENPEEVVMSRLAHVLC